jgi:DNA-binding NarL/FixJ family response regulator
VLVSAIEVLVVDDEPSLLRMLSQMFEFDEAVALCGSAATTAEAIVVALGKGPDVIVLDEHARGTTADAVRRLLQAAPGAHVIVLGDSSSDRTPLVDVALISRDVDRLNEVVHRLAAQVKQH